MGGAHSAPTLPHMPQHPNPAAGRGHPTRHHPLAPAPAPSASGSRVGGRGGPRGAGCAARPKSQPGMFRRWREDGRATPQAEAGVGVAEGREESSAPSPPPGPIPSRPPAGGRRRAGWARAKPGAAGAVRGGVESRPPPSGPAPGSGWGPEVRLLELFCLPRFEQDFNLLFSSLFRLIATLEDRAELPHGFSKAVNLYRSRLSSLSPSEWLLFNMYAEQIIREAGLYKEEWGNRIGGRLINNLRYTDDTTLLAESEEDLKHLLMKIKDRSLQYGLHLNV
ncbi:translation initiation factor IF-2-like [Elephas maximus indicus]|uniref:translation initiation factor IF-2-like n=1 Tax=Elephas maximus indicus TaxID=99487 RepID=UPI002115DB94|nr:translation initiation factor IF-2-like [Elephas maximus indicus]